MTRRSPVVLTMVFLLGAVQFARAQHQHDGRENADDRDKTAQFAAPRDYATAIEEIERRLNRISRFIESKELDKVHTEADAIQKVAMVIGRLALKGDSGVPTDAVTRVNLVGKDLAARFAAIERAGDLGDLAGTRKVYFEMVILAGTLKTYLAGTFQCPMRCEGERTYDKPGKCPKCGMALKDVRSHLDHEAKHGGVFFMTPDQKHHLEGTLSSTKEFRVYFYDEYAKPIPVDKFTVEATAMDDGPGEVGGKPLELAPAPDKSFLAGKVDASIKSPLSIKALIDFKDGQKPQVFDFDFISPSKEPVNSQKEEHGHCGH